MQISTFKLSDVELKSGFFMQNILQLTHLNNCTQESLNICNISCCLGFLFYTKSRKSSRKSLSEFYHLLMRPNQLPKSPCFWL